jgi:hypothetical protein
MPDYNQLQRRAAGILFQYRDEPAPLGKRDRATNDPKRADYYYTDYRTRTDLVNPLHERAKRFWREQVPAELPRLWARAEKSAGDLAEGHFGDDPRSIWPLGPGLVPRESGEQEAHELVGGTNLNCEDPFGEWAETELSLSPGGGLVLPNWSLTDPLFCPVERPRVSTCTSVINLGCGKRPSRPPAWCPHDHKTVDLHSRDDYLYSYWLLRAEGLLRP